MTEVEKTKYAKYPRLVVELNSAAISGWNCDELEHLGFEILYSEVSTICDMALYIVKDIPTLKNDLPHFIKLYKNMNDQKTIKQ